MSEYTPMDYGTPYYNPGARQNAWVTVNTLSPPLGFSLPPMDGMPSEWYAMITSLLNVWGAKLARNRLRRRYYDGKNKLKDFGISTPPQLLNVETVVGWPQKAVDALAVRSRFDGFSANDPDVQAVLNAVAESSRIKIKYRQAVQGELIHSCCFATVKRDESGSARIDIYDAEMATAAWDDAAGRVAYGLVINGVQNGQLTAFELILPDYIVTCEFIGAKWQWKAEPHSMGVAPMAAFAYRPTLRKPFGVSRINRSVMSITDSAVRVALGGDISYQFAVSPQKYLLNVDKDPFDRQTKWEAYIGSIFTVGNDDDTSSPIFGQLTQASMEQTIGYMRLLASRFAAETNIPLAQLGVASDANPSSAEALYAASEPLIIEAEDLNDGARQTLKDLGVMALSAVLDLPVDQLPDEALDFSAIMRNPAMPSIVSQADAMIKVASVVPAFAGTDTFFEQLGFSEDIRRRIKSDIAASEGNTILNAIFGGGGDGANTASVD